MAADPSVMHVDCDLYNCINTAKLAKEFPNQTINAGIAEANAMGVAAGLTATGKKVWMHSFGCFSSRRAFDQAFMSAAYAKLGVKVLGSDPGVCAAQWRHPYAVRGLRTVSVRAGFHRYRSDRLCHGKQHYQEADCC